MRESAQGMRQTTHTRVNIPAVRTLGTASVATAAGLKRNNLLGTSATLSSQYSILGRHRMQKVRPEEKSTPQASAAQPNGQIASMGIPQFLKRMSMGVMNK
jgi:hypothetical protein